MLGKTIEQSHKESKCWNVLSSKKFHTDGISLCV